MKKDFEIIATINTKNLDKDSLLQLVRRGATIFRINGAFITINNVKEEIDFVRNIVGNSIKILIDLPGYKIRFLYLNKEIEFKTNSLIELKKEYFNYPDFLNLIRIGTLIRTNNGFNTFTVTEKRPESIVCIADSDGVITRGKGMHIHGVSFRPSSDALSPYDLELLDVVKQHDVDYVGMSFVHDKEDVKYVENRLSDTKIKCIPKIEAKESIYNLYPILKHSEMAILDRGDLAGEIGLDLIWKTQREIICLSKLLDCRIILATQFLSSMISNPVPSIAEVDSLYDLLALGINGIQLSEEVSIGKYAHECINVVNSAVNNFKFKPNDILKIEEGTVFWILGLTSSGKTSIAKKIIEKLSERGIVLIHYDGDEVRDLFGSDYGFSEEERFQVVKNLVYLSNKSASQGFNVIVSALTAHERARKYVRENIKKLVTIFLECSIEECARRDPKGLYKKAQNGGIETVVGFGSTYDVPEGINLTINTENASIEESANKVIDFMIENGIFLRR